MRQRVVVVDDHTGIAEMVGRTLVERLPIDMLPTIATFAEALATLPTAKPDLVILDQRLGEQRGIDLLPPLDWRLPQTKWLLYSGYLNQRIVLEAVALGVSGAVSKRAPEHVLVAAVSQILAGQGYFCEGAARFLRESAALKGFSPTECRILEQIAAGNEAKEIAAALGLSHKTVLNDLVELRRKTGVQSLVDLAEFAKAHGLASPR